MNILNVNDLLDPVSGGGTAERTMQISRALNESGLECTILSWNKGLDEAFVSGLSDIRLVSCRSLFNRYFIPLVSYKSIKLEVSKADIIHLMGHWSLLNMLVYMAAMSLSKPYVVCPAGALPIFGRSRIIKKIYNWLIGKKIIHNASAWIAITEEEKSQFTPYGINCDKITVIPNGINPSDFPDKGAEQFRKKHGLAKKKFILFLGRLNLIKGPDILLDAFCRVQADWSEWHLVFAGPDGGLLDSLVKKADTKGLQDRVHFIGYVGGDEKSAAYHAADLLVIPSRQEAMSIVVLEAGISATPVLMTDQCGFEQVDKIGGGKICPATVDGIFNGLHDIIGGSECLIGMGKKLEIHISQNFTWQIVIRRYIELYSSLLQSSQ